MEAHLLKALLHEVLAPHSRQNARIEFNQRVILQALKVLLERDQDMSKVHDDIAAALAANAASLSTADTKVAQLAALKDESDDAFNDILASVTAQKDVVSGINDKLDKALAGATPAGASSGSSTSVSGALSIPVSTTVSAPVSAPAIIIPVASTSGVVEGATVSGPGITEGTTVVDVNHVASTVTLSDPTTADHTGDGTETVKVSSPATSAA